MRGEKAAVKGCSGRWEGASFQLPRGAALKLFFGGPSPPPLSHKPIPTASHRGTAASHLFPFRFSSPFPFLPPFLCHDARACPIWDHMMGPSTGAPGGHGRGNVSCSPSGPLSSRSAGWDGKGGPAEGRRQG